MSLPMSRSPSSCLLSVSAALSLSQVSSFRFPALPTFFDIAHFLTPAPVILLLFIMANVATLPGPFSFSLPKLTSIL